MRESAVCYVAGWAARRSLAVEAEAPIAAAAAAAVAGVGPIVAEAAPIGFAEVPIAADGEGGMERRCTVVVGPGSPGGELDPRSLTSAGLCIL